MPNAFKKKNGSLCLGSLDEKHIYIQPPAQSSCTFRNYKCRFSVLMLAAVDANCNFIYVNVGTQVRVSDAGLFENLDLKRALDDELINVPQPKRMLSASLSTNGCVLINNADITRLSHQNTYGSCVSTQLLRASWV